MQWNVKEYNDHIKTNKQVKATCCLSLVWLFLLACVAFIVSIYRFVVKHFEMWILNYYYHHLYYYNYSLICFCFACALKYCVIFNVLSFNCDIHIQYEQQQQQIIHMLKLVLQVTIKSFERPNWIEIVVLLSLFCCA